MIKNYLRTKLNQEKKQIYQQYNNIYWTWNSSQIGFDIFDVFADFHNNMIQLILVL